jgi:uncharacterized protein YfaT (DUF1175 family)
MTRYNLPNNYYQLSAEQKKKFNSEVIATPEVIRINQGMHRIMKAFKPYSAKAATLVKKHNIKTCDDYKDIAFELMHYDPVDFYHLINKMEFVRICKAMHIIKFIYNHPKVLSDENMAFNCMRGAATVIMVFKKRNVNI